MPLAGAGVRPGKVTVKVHLGGDARPLLTLNDLEMPDNWNQWARERFGYDRRVMFIPDAKVLITIPTTADRLVLHKLDVDKALEKSEVDYLFVTSSPPTEVRKGATYTYPLAVKSRKGGVKYSLASGPTGMTVSKEGVVKWTAPKDFAEAEVNVIISITDRTEQEVFHTYTLAVRP
jgi:hypothetical protein